MILSFWVSGTFQTENSLLKLQVSEYSSVQPKKYNETLNQGNPSCPPPKLTPPQVHKGLIAGLIKGTQWLRTPEKNRSPNPVPRRRRFTAKRHPWISSSAWMPSTCLSGVLRRVGVACCPIKGFPWEKDGIFTWNPFVLCFASKRRFFPIKTRVIWVPCTY